MIKKGLFSPFFIRRGIFMGLIAQVIVNIATSRIQKAFSYSIPEHLSHVDIGWRVVIPFGARVVEGFVIGKMEADTSKLKPLIDAMDEEPWFDSHMLQTAQWISQYYICSAGEALRLFIPGKSGLKSATGYCLREDTAVLAEEFLTEKPEDYRRLYYYLQKHGTTGEPALLREFGVDTKKILRYLLRQKGIRTATIHRKTAKPRYETLVSLAIDHQEASAILHALPERNGGQKRLLAALLAEGPLSMTALRDSKVLPDTVHRLEKTGVLQIRQVQLIRDSYAGSISEAHVVQLTEEQGFALAAIEQAVRGREYHSFLLHGITGSGKTQVYLEAVATVRKLGRQAIVLVPEIALTHQIVRRFKSRFGTDVVVVHSRLSAGERFDAWQRIRSGEAGIVIGARSAVFAPLADIGIIIIDEEHEFTYKQEEAPRYHAREVAQTRACLAGAVVVLGSATPAVETYYEAQQGRHTLLSLTTRIGRAVLPTVEVVDMREELRRGQRSVISEALQELLTQTVVQGGQAVILLNRRGYSTFVMCRECGQVLHCRHCAISLVYHLAGRTLRCHYCGRGTAVPDVCPHCGSRYIKFFGTGTQKVEEELGRLVPQARIIRMDQDTTGSKMGHEKIISAFTAGRYDILLGTQMVAKGHDIENVIAVGMISADTALNLPDFRAAEKTFALITQLAGRAGRGHKSGKVVVQTYNPDHFAIRTGADQDYNSFFSIEIASRSELGYPPFGKLLKIVIQGATDEQARRRAEAVAGAVRHAVAHIKDCELIGPFPAAVVQVKDVFRMNIMIKAPALTEVKKQLIVLELDTRADTVIDVDPVNVM